MQPREFAEAIAKIAADHKLTRAQVASGCVAVLLTLCEAAGEDPIEYMRWAMQESQELKDRKGKN